MNIPLTLENLSDILKTEPTFRINQVLQAFFDIKYSSFSDITALPKNIREILNQNIDFSTLISSEVRESKYGKTFKSILTLSDNFGIESVLMENAKDSWTICVSTQIGCPIKCVFCSTGAMGFKRNLDALEIVEQYLMWKKFILSGNFKNQRISNIVLMGMGEPLLNYENVKKALGLIIKYSDVGPNYITVSTVGIMDKLKLLLNDPEWPKVKIAISLHSVNSEIRKKLIPVHKSEFLTELKNWAKEYEKDYGKRTRPLTFEYVMINGVNDSMNDAKDLIKFLKGTHRSKVNLIPFNVASNPELKPPKESNVLKFKNFLNESGVVATVRKSHGDDISAACGQLIANSERGILT